MCLIKPIATIPTLVGGQYVEVFNSLTEGGLTLSPMVSGWVGGIGR